MSRSVKSFEIRPVRTSTEAKYGRSHLFFRLAQDTWSKSQGLVKEHKDAIRNSGRRVGAVKVLRAWETCKNHACFWAATTLNSKNSRNYIIPF